MRQWDVDAGCGEFGQYPVEGGKLFGAVCPFPVTRSIRYGEMREDAFEDQTRKLVQCVNKRQRLTREDAQPAHAGVHLDVDTRGTVQGQRRAGERAGHIEIEDGGGQIVSQDVARLPGRGVTEHQDRRPDASLT